MKCLSLLLIAFSLLVSCRSRIFNNPNDPGKDERGYEILSIIHIESGRSPYDITFAGDSIWMTQNNSQLLSLNYTSGAVIRELMVTRPSAGIAYDQSNLWVIGEGSGIITAISIINGEIIRELFLSEGNFSYLDYRDPYLYIADKLSNTIITVDPLSGSTIGSVRSPSFSIGGFCFDGERYWILEPSEMKLYVTDTSGTILNTFRTPTDHPSGLACSNDIIWMGDRSGKILKMRFD